MFNFVKLIYNLIFMDRQTKDLIVSNETLQLGYFSLKLQKFLQRLWKTPSVFTALITQAGTSDPTTKVLNNTLGNLVFTRTDAGTYNIVSNGLFIADKTAPNSDSYIDLSENKITIEYSDVNTMIIKTYAAVDTSVLADGILTDQYLNIEVYNN